MTLRILDLPSGLCAALFVAAAVACSPAAPFSDPDDVLQALIDIPEVPCPIVTASNALDPGLVQATQYCDLIALLRNQLPAIVRQIRESGSVPARDGDVLTWRWTAEYQDWDSTLEVTVTDSVSFVYTRSWTDPMYQTVWSGWVSPKESTGRYLYRSDRFGWRRGPQGWLMGGRLALMGVGVMDSTRGGATVGASDITLGMSIFEAGWGTDGHGWWGVGHAW